MMNQKDTEKKVNLIVKWVGEMDPFSANALICTLMHQEIKGRENNPCKYDVDWFENFFLKSIDDIDEIIKKGGIV